MSQNVLVVFGDKTADEILSALKTTSDRYLLHQVVKIFYDMNDCSWEGQVKRWQGEGWFVHYVIGVTDLPLRIMIQEHADRLGMQAMTVVAESAMVDPSATLGCGCFVAAQAIVSCNAVLGEHCVVHFHSSVGHDARLGRHCLVLPGARISGGVTLGPRVLVGSNAFVLQNVSLGEGVQVDAMTYVQKDVPPRRIVSVRRGLGG